MTTSEHGGYKNPPKKHQWQPGQSGNPSGKKKAPDKSPQPILEILMAQLYSPESVTIKGKKQTIPMASLFVLTVLRNAINAPLPQQIKALLMLKSLGIFEKQDLLVEEEDDSYLFSETEKRYLAILTEELRESGDSE